MPRSRKRKPKQVASAPVSPTRQILETFHQRDFAKVVRLCDRALGKNPRNVDILNLLGGAHIELGDADSAIDVLTRAATLKPGDPVIESNLGSVLATARRFAEAETRLETALARAPDDTDILANLARVQCELGHFDKALGTFGAILARAPNDAGLLAEAIRAAVLAGDTGIAKQYAARAIALDVKDPALQHQITRVLHEHGLYAESLAAVNGALAHNPNDISLLVAKGVVLSRLQRPDDALASFDQAIRIEPDNADAVLWRAFLNLSVGRFREGWADYRARQTQRSTIAPNSLGACGGEYHGEPLPDDMTGAAVLVDRDQGLGDEIFFLRYVRALRDRGANVTYRADVRLSGMLRRAEIADHVIAQADPDISYDYLVSVCDLPRLLVTDNTDTVPPSITLSPLADHAAKIESQLAAFGNGPYIGATWRAGTAGNNRFQHKEVPAERLARALSNTAGTVVVLQRNPAPGEIDAFSRALGRPVLDLSHLNADLEALLALCALFDSYVGVSGTNVHFREACGLTSDVLVPYPPEFRWMLSGDESPWFPGSAVYRQGADGDWDAALARITGTLGGAGSDIRLAG